MYRILLKDVKHYLVTFIKESRLIIAKSIAANKYGFNYNDGRFGNNSAWKKFTSSMLLKPCFYAYFCLIGQHPRD